jgi:hypothetical protein
LTPCRERSVLSSSVFQTRLWCTQPVIPWVPVDVPPAEERPGSAADHWPLIGWRMREAIPPRPDACLRRGS